MRPLVWPLRCSTRLMQAPATRAQIQAVTTAMNAYANANQTMGAVMVVHNLQTHMVVDRLTDSKIKLAVKKCEL
jgi:hypothetical protein